MVNWQCLLTINCFLEKIPSQMFGKALRTLLPIFLLLTLNIFLSTIHLLSVFILTIWDVAEYDANIIVTIQSRMFVIETKCVHNFMDYSS